MLLDGVSRFCFGASYAAALGLEAARIRWPGKVLRGCAVGFALAGLLAHTLYLGLHPPPLSTPAGSLLCLSWVLAIFAVYGVVHYKRTAWAVFALPLVLVFVVLGDLFARRVPVAGESWAALVTGERFWGVLHGVLLLLAAVGVCVGFLASVMYLEQARRLRAKLPPLGAVKLLSLERLEAMNRRAIVWAFPLLTAGLAVGALLLGKPVAAGDWQVAGTWGLWVVFVALLFLRYSLRARGRVLAVGTIAAFGLLVAVLAATHPVAAGGGP